MAAIDRLRDQIRADERAYCTVEFRIDGVPNSTCGAQYRCQTGRLPVCDDVILNDQPSGPGIKIELWMVPDLMRVGFIPIFAYLNRVFFTPPSMKSTGAWVHGLVRSRNFSRIECVPPRSSSAAKVSFLKNFTPPELLQERARGEHVLNREMVAEVAGLRVQVLTLVAGQRVPWHHHSEITDSFVCLEGMTVVETRTPRETHQLKPGQRCAVGPNTAHTVHGIDDGPCKFMLIQGVGTYDFMPIVE